MKRLELALMTLCAFYPALPMQDWQRLNARFIEAARHGDLAEVQQLLSDGAHINGRTQDEDHESALLCAARNNHIPVVEFLLNAGANPNLASTLFDDITPLFIAAAAGHAKICHQLVAAGADILIKPDLIAFTPLGIACQRNHLEVVKTFLTTPLGVEYKKFKAARCGLIAIRYAQPLLPLDMRLFIDQKYIDSFVEDHMIRLKEMLTSTEGKIAQNAVAGMNKNFNMNNRELAQLLDLHNPESYAIIQNEVKALIRRLLIPKPKRTKDTESKEAK